MFCVMLKRCLEEFYTAKVSRYSGLEKERRRVSGGEFTPHFSFHKCFDFKDVIIVPVYWVATVCSLIEVMQAPNT